VNVKTAISMPEELFSQVNEIAQKEGLSRSGVITRAVDQYVRREKWRRIKESYDEAYADGLDEDEKAWLKFGSAQMTERLKDDRWDE